MRFPLYVLNFPMTLTKVLAHRQQQKMSARNDDFTISASVFFLAVAITFSVYVSTVSESIAGGDSGELVAEGCML